VVEAGETVSGSQVVSLMIKPTTIASQRAVKTFLKPSSITLMPRLAWMPVQIVLNAVPSNIIQRDGKDQGVSTSILDLAMTEPSKPHQREDGEMQNAMPELVNTRNEMELEEINFMIN
jgi:hypothetical protein